jgi:hypothetical protein
MRLSLKSYLSLLLVALCTSHLPAISIRHDVPQSEYFDLAAQFPAAGSVRLNNGLWCSGTLVAPDKVLTAAHCTQGRSPNSLSFRHGANVALPTHSRQVSNVSVSPNYTGSERSDLSVLTLSIPINDVDPLPISLQNPAGMVATMLGYGYHGNGLTFNFASDNRKRAAQNLINVATSTTVRTDFDHPNGSTSTYAPSTAEALEGTTAGGDSGGPLTVDFGQGEVIVGVLHGGFNNFNIDSRYGDISIWAPINRPANISYLESHGLTIVDGTISGDFNGDGAYDCLDIDDLTAAIAGGMNDLTYDMNSDGNVNLDDRDEWLAVAGAQNLPSGNPYLPADANLDGVVDGVDFITWNSHRFTDDDAFCNGDLNADGFVDGSDFTIWNEFKFQSSDSMQTPLQAGFTRPFEASPTAVPEPSTCVIMLCGVLLAAGRRR